MSGQDESNPVLWLATWVGKMELQMYLALWLAIWAGKMELSCPLGTTCRVPHIINPWLTKLAWSRWLDIGLVLFLWVYGPQLHLGLKHAKKELTQYPANLPHTWSITHTYTKLIAVRFELQNVSIANTCTLILYILVKKNWQVLPWPERERKTWCKHASKCKSTNSLSCYRILY